MKIEVTTDKVQQLSGDALIVSASREKGSKTVTLSPIAKEVDSALGGVLSEIAAAGEFNAAQGELATIYTLGKLEVKRIILVGLGSQGQGIRRASAAATRHLQSTAARQVILAIASDEAGMQAEVEGALIGTYTFRKYQTGEKTKALESVKVLATGNTNAEQALQRGLALGEATNFARDLINEPPNVLTPTELANRAQEMARNVGLESRIIDKPEMEQLGMGGLLAVSKGSAQAPKFIILQYKGAPDTQKGLALVGKGITFDSGGISIKPAANMDEMKGDMGGAAAVIGAMQAIARLKPVINVTAFVSSAENLPSGTSYLPGDILKIMNGKTIEINNTDAEGRLVLADALSYAVKEGLDPIIDVATLTGGIVVALGYTMTGLFSNDEQLTNDIIEAGRQAGEKYWPMPIDEEYMDYIKSEVADIKQSAGPKASSVTAAKILQQFVGESRWAHLDIAGTSYLEKKPYQEKGGTGVAVRSLAELAVKLAAR